jgi:uncharacterized ferritin-like protein (DUF455 family)
MIDRLQRAGDVASAEILQVIYHEEHDHVRKGAIWFDAICRARSTDPVESFRGFVATRFAGDLKPPFNQAARSASGMPLAYYISAAETDETGADVR